MIFYYYEFCLEVELDFWIKYVFENKLVMRKILCYEQHSFWDSMKVIKFYDLSIADDILLFCGDK